MKRPFEVFLILILALSLTACGAKERPTDLNAAAESETEVLTAEALTTAEPTTEAPTTAGDPNAEYQYVVAVKKAYQDIYQVRVEEEDEEIKIYAWMVDLNGDGYKDLIYRARPFLTPNVMVYDRGAFVDCKIEPEVLGGSMFPSGEKSGFFVDAEKGVIYVRYDGHTSGTVYFRGAQAFQITGTEAKSLWVEYFDSEAAQEDPRYDSDTWEEYVSVDKLISEEFDEQIAPRIKDYQFVNFFDVCVLWDGSVI